MPIEGVDYSLGRPDPACLFANGKRFASRYLSPPGGIDKDLSLAEAQKLTNAGIAIVCNWEDSTGAPLKGFTRGVSDAGMAWEHAIACGMPRSRPIYFSIDFEASTAQLQNELTQYFRGIATVMPLSQIGAYGGLATIKFLFDNHLITWGWQTYAWSHGVWDSRAQVQQYKNSTTVCGVSLDLDRAMVADYGQWFFGQPDEGDLQMNTEVKAAFDAVTKEVKGLADAVTALQQRVDDMATHTLQRDKDQNALIRALAGPRELAHAELAAAKAYQDALVPDPAPTPAATKR